MKIPLFIYLFGISLKNCEGNFILPSDNVSIIDNILAVADLPWHKIVPKINDIDLGMTKIKLP